MLTLPQQLFARIFSLGGFSRYVRVEVRNGFGRRAVVLAFENADANGASRGCSGQPEWNADVATYVTVAGQQHDTVAHIRPNRLRHDDVARHLRTRPGSQHLAGQQAAMANRDRLLVFAPEVGA